MLERALYAREGIELVESGAQFTCFTGTTVQILTELVEADFVDNSACVELIENKGWGIQVNPKFTCFTGTKVQILTLKLLPGYPR